MLGDPPLYKLETLAGQHGTNRAIEIPLQVEGGTGTLKIVETLLPTTPQTSLYFVQLDAKDVPNEALEELGEGVDSVQISFCTKDFGSYFYCSGVQFDLAGIFYTNRSVPYLAHLGYSESTGSGILSVRGQTKLIGTASAFNFRFTGSFIALSNVNKLCIDSDLGNQYG